MTNTHLDNLANDLEKTVERMRALGIRRLRTNAFEIDLLDEAPPPENVGAADDVKSESTETQASWAAADSKRRPRLKKFDDK